jgi:hypothetical protein
MLEVEEPNPISGGDKQQLSSDGAVYEGNTHEQGGINIGNAEIEDQEVIQNDRIYSDRLNPSEQVVTLVNQLGFKGNKKDTYASLSESLLKQKGKYEKGNDNLSIRTGEKMASRIDEVLNIVFADQQSKNNDQGMKKAYGGYVGNDPTKRKLPKDVAVSYSTTLGDNPLVKVDENDPLIYDKNEFINYYRNKTVNAFDPDTRASYDDILNKQGNENADAYLASRGGLPNFDSYQKIVRDYEKTNINNPTDWANLNSNISAPSGYRYNANFGQGLPAKGSITRKRAYGGTIPDYDPDYEAYIINNRLPINTIGGLDTAPTNFSRLTPKEQLLGDPVSLGYTNDPTLYGRSNDPLLGGPASLGYANINNNIPNPNVPSVPNITGNDNTNSSTSSNRRRGYNSDLYNLVGTGVNQSIIDRMKTETPARTVLEPGFSYTDMSSPAYNKNTRNFREAVLTARKYGSLTPGTVSNLYASKIENDANIAANESARRQGAVEGYQNRTQQARQYNSGVLSQNDFYNTQRHNEKLGLTQGNINNFIQGAIGNETVRNQTSLDRDRALITSTLEGNRGITKRQLTSNPQLKEAYTRMFGEEYVKRILEQ